MRYLFFDIECSNCFNGVGKMCEFGYVLTDENLNVIKKSEIPMSPGRGRENRFHLKGRKHEKDLELAYEYDYYLEQPEFPRFYGQIKNLIEDSDTICFAYSMDNDIPHLYHACKRYGLKPFDYICYDVQKLVGRYLEIKVQLSLHNACREIVGPNAMVRLQEHLSRDDAEMERLIFEAICVLTKTDSTKLLEESDFAKTRSIDYMDNIKNRVSKKRERKEGYELYSSLALDEEELDKPEYIGRRYNVSNELKNDLLTLKKTLSLIKEKNGVLSKKVSKTDIFIAANDKNREEMINGFKVPFEGKFLTYEEFAKDNLQIHLSR